MKYIGSVFDNEQDLFKAIIKIHCDGKPFELDPTYSKGHFYLEIPQPKYKFDIDPQTDDTVKALAENLPVKDSSIRSMVVDLPFMFGVHGNTEEYMLSKRFGIFKDFAELELLYIGILKEAYRILKNKGVLVFKCQDYTDGKTTMTHCLVYNWAVKIGFYAKDLAILKKSSRFYNPNKIQRHFRKTHSYFWVFRK